MDDHPSGYARAEGLGQPSNIPAMLGGSAVPDEHDE
jgi:hypothetical protein